MLVYHRVNHVECDFFMLGSNHPLSYWFHPEGASDVGLTRAWHRTWRIFLGFRENSWGYPFIAGWFIVENPIQK